jgi:hypothetical protein
MQIAVEATTSSATPLLTKYVLCNHAYIFSNDAGSETMIHHLRPQMVYHYYFSDHNYSSNPYII